MLCAWCSSSLRTHASLLIDALLLTLHCGGCGGRCLRMFVSKDFVQAPVLYARQAFTE